MLGAQRCLGPRFWPEGSHAPPPLASTAFPALSLVPRLPSKWPHFPRHSCRCGSPHLCLPCSVPPCFVCSSLRSVVSQPRAVLCPEGNPDRAAWGQSTAHRGDGISRWEVRPNQRRREAHVLGGGELRREVESLRKYPEKRELGYQTLPKHFWSFNE